MHNAPSSPLFENVNRLAAGRGHCATAGSEKRAAAEAIMRRLVELRARCQRQTNSFVTPMGDEMFYRYQQSLIDEAATTVGALLQRLARSTAASLPAGERLAQPQEFLGPRITDHTPGEVSRPSVPNLQMRCANSPLDRYVLTVTVELEGSGAEGAHEER